MKARYFITCGYNGDLVSSFPGAHFSDEESFTEALGRINPYLLSDKVLVCISSDYTLDGDIDIVRDAKPVTTAFMPCQFSDIPVRKEDVFIPPRVVADNAERGLALQREYKRGGTTAGIQRATLLSKREPVDMDTVKKIYSYFAKHQHDDLEWKNQPSDSYIAWQLRGGDEGRRWATKAYRAHRAVCEGVDGAQASSLLRILGARAEDLDKLYDLGLGKIKTLIDAVNLMVSNPRSINPTSKETNNVRKALKQAGLRSIKQLQGVLKDVANKVSKNPDKTKEMSLFKVNPVARRDFLFGLPKLPADPVFTKLSQVV